MCVLFILLERENEIIHVHKTESFILFYQREKIKLFSEESECVCVLYYFVREKKINSFQKRERERERGGLSKT